MFRNGAGGDGVDGAVEDAYEYSLDDVTTSPTFPNDTPTRDAKNSLSNASPTSPNGTSTSDAKNSLSKATSTFPNGTSTSDAKNAVTFIDFIANELELSLTTTANINPLYNPSNVSISQPTNVPFNIFNGSKNRLCMALLNILISNDMVKFSLKLALIL